MTTRFIDHLLEGDHASRPAANAVPMGTLYACSDHDLIYQSDTSSWATWADVSGSGGAGIPATILDAKGDLIVATAADTAARQAVGANGTVLMAASGQTNGIRWTPGLSFSRRLIIYSSNVTENVNTATYADFFPLQFYHDWDAFPATHFLITGLMCSNAAAQSILLQLAPQSAPTNPVSAGGDDITIPNNGGVVTQVSSGWIAVSDSMSGITLMVLAIKGTNSTVDLAVRWLDIAFKIAT